MLQHAWSILCDSAVFILVGFAVAGLLHVVIARESILGPLRRRGTRSVFVATLIGLPLPLCSCSVLPTAVTLRRKGASAGAVSSFLISTPETSVTSILLTYGLLGPVMAIFRPIAACVTAILAGIATNALDRTPDGDVGVTPAPAPPAGIDPDCGCDADVATAEPVDVAGPTPAATPAPGILARGRVALRYAFVDLFDDIFGWVVLGVVAAAIIQTWLPADTLTRLTGGPLQSMLIMLLVGLPLYVCAEASTPVAAAFIAQGLGPGAALVFLLVGPATNAGSIGILRNLLGRRLVIAYLAAIALVALIMGAALDALVTSTGYAMDARALDASTGPVWLNRLAGVVFLALGIGTLRRRRMLDRLAGWLNARLPFDVGRTPTMIALGAGLVAAWLTTGIARIAPGELGVARVFGAIVAADLGPGLHVSWPPPIGSIDVLPRSEVRRLVLGISDGESRLPDGAGRWRDNIEDTRHLVGDENIANLVVSVHWGADASHILDFGYGVRQPEVLVRNVVLATLREVVAGRSINELFTVARHDVESTISSRAGERLAAYRSGIRVHDVRLLDVHAPAAVHDAFRDVASATEDRATVIDLARADEAAILPGARARATEIELEAAAYRARTVAEARGDVAGFPALSAVGRRWPDVTRRRLRLEALEKTLPRLKTYLTPASKAGDGSLEIWLTEPGAEIPVPPMEDTEP